MSLILMLMLMLMLILILRWRMKRRRWSTMTVVTMKEVVDDEVIRMQPDDSCGSYPSEC